MKTKLNLCFILIFAVLQINVVSLAKAQQPLRKVNAPSRTGSSAIYQGLSPRKLNIEAMNQKTTLSVGNRVRFVITLLDNNNREVSAFKDVVVEISFTSDQKNFDRKNITIPAGSSRVTTTYVPGQDKSGILHVRVVNNELLEGSTFVKVLEGPGASIKNYPGNNSVFKFVSISQPSNYPYILISIDTSRAYLADGIDEAEVLISFEDPHHSIAEDSIFVFANSGGGQILQPDGFYINRTDLKKFKIVSKRKGIIKPRINVHNLTIPIENNGPEIRFIPPIDFFKITAGPPAIHLLNRTKIVVTLFDRDTVPIETDEDMRINLLLLEGDGSLLPDTSLVISKGSSTATGIFIPNSTGKVLIEGHIPSFTAQVLEKPIQVSWPVLIIMMIFAGGFLGSLAFLLHKKPRGFKNWFSRIAAGTISGLVLYLLYVTGVYKNVFIQSNINLTLVCLLAVAGGYLGEDVLVLTGEKIKSLMKLGKQTPSAG